MQSMYLAVSDSVLLLVQVSSTDRHPERDPNRCPVHHDIRELVWSKNETGCITLPHLLTVYSLDSKIWLQCFGWLSLTILGLFKGNTQCPIEHMEECGLKSRSLRQCGSTSNKMLAFRNSKDLGVSVGNFGSSSR